MNRIYNNYPVYEQYSLARISFFVKCIKTRFIMISDDTCHDAHLLQKCAIIEIFRSGCDRKLITSSS